jgi:hypothetical protein
MSLGIVDGPARKVLIAAWLSRVVTSLAAEELLPNCLERPRIPLGVSQFGGMEALPKVYGARLRTTHRVHQVAFMFGRDEKGTVQELTLFTPRPPGTGVCVAHVARPDAGRTADSLCGPPVDQSHCAGS